jgi:hypothetical protein
MSAVLLLGWSVIFVAPAEYTVIDTHVHHADVSHIAYTFPSSFPDLNHNWTNTMFTQAWAHQQHPTRMGGILMELEKANNTWEVSMAEARWFQSVADACAAHPEKAYKTCTPIVGIVASAVFESGATGEPDSRATQAISHRPCQGLQSRGKLLTLLNLHNVP